MTKDQWSKYPQTLIGLEQKLSGSWKLLSRWVIVFIFLPYQNWHKVASLNIIGKISKEIMFKSWKGIFFRIHFWRERITVFLNINIYKPPLVYVHNFELNFKLEQMCGGVFFFFIHHLSSQQHVQLSYQLWLKLIHILIMSEFCLCLFLWDTT